MSNSSSTSFVLSCPADFEVAQRLGMAWYRAADLLAAIEDLRSRISKAFPYFLEVHFWVDCEDELRQRVAMDPEACITDAYDRDRAYEVGIDLPVFANL